MSDTSLTFHSLGAPSSRKGKLRKEHAVITGTSGFGNRSRFRHWSCSGWDPPPPPHSTPPAWPVWRQVCLHAPGRSSYLARNHRNWVPFPHSLALQESGWGGMGPKLVHDKESEDCQNGGQRGGGQPLGGGTPLKCQKPAEDTTHQGVREERCPPQRAGKGGSHSPVF